MSGWHVHLLGADVATREVAFSDFLSLSIQDRIGDVGTIEMLLPRAAEEKAQAFNVGRRFRLYRGAAVMASGIITDRIWTRAATRIRGTTLVSVLQNLYLPKGVPILSSFQTSYLPSLYLRPAHVLLDYLRRPVHVCAYAKDRWADCTITGTTPNADGDLPVGVNVSVTIESPWIDTYEAGGLLDHCFVNVAGPSPDIFGTLTVSYATSAAPGTPTWVTLSTTVTENYVQNPPDTASGARVCRVLHPSHTSDIPLQRYLKIRAEATGSSSAPATIYELAAVYFGPAHIAKGTWPATSWNVGWTELGESWYGRNVFEILKQVLMPRGFQWAIGADEALHIYAPGETRNFGTFANEQVSPEDLPWTTPSNAQTSNDVRTSVSHLFEDSTTRYSQRLRCTNAGFTIPTDATINGIRIRVERHKAHWASTTDYRIQLYKAGSLVGSNKAATGEWPTSDAYASYGGATDLWGTTWTPAEINATDFGVAVSAALTSAFIGGEAGLFIFPEGHVDHVEVTVWWTEAIPAPLGVDRRESVALVWGDTAAGNEWVRESDRYVKTQRHVRSILGPTDPKSAPDFEKPVFSYIGAADAVTAFGGRTEDLAGTVGASNTALHNDGARTIDAHQEPGVEITVDLLPITDALQAIRPGDLVTLIVPEHGTRMGMHVRKLSVSAAGMAEQWQVVLAAPGKSPWTPHKSDKPDDRMPRVKAPTTELPAEIRE